MAQRNDGGPAFPVDPDVAGHEALRGSAMGMTLRDYFAGKAMQGFSANPSHASVDFNPEWEGYDGGVPEEFQQTAREAYLMADAMLAEREREN